MSCKNLTLDFALFLETWNMLQGFKTPKVHCRIADWLQKNWEAGETRLLLMAFRSCGKSTLVGLFCAWLLWRDPNFRIMVLAAESNLASKMVRNIKKIVEIHPFTKGLKPSNPEQWGASSFIINRDVESRDPSVIAAGITGNITGSRADLIIYDDVEVPNTCDSEEKRKNLRERLSESGFVLSAGGRRIYVGTPHSYFSIYADKPRKEINEDAPYLDGFKSLKIPILDKSGKSAWVEKYPIKEIEDIKKEYGPNKFNSQMMLEPDNVLDSRLDVNLLNFYADELNVHEAGGELRLTIGDVVNGVSLVSCSAWWDPAFGSARGDSSVLAIVYSDDEGNKYIHHIEYIQIDNLQENQDEASQQCKIVAGLSKDFFIPSITIETNGIGQFLPEILKRELRAVQINCAVLQKHNFQNKNTRILENYDAIMAAKSLYIHEKVQKTPYLTEMMEWQPKYANNKDDGLDAVAGALSLEPVRIKRGFYIGSYKSWQGSSKSFNASSEFEV